MTQDENQISSKQQSKTSKLTLLLLLAFFAFPIIIVVTMHQLNIHPKGSSHGQLFSPSIPINIPADLTTKKGLAVDSKFWGSRWNMIYISADCNKTCETRVQEVRQIHVSLAKEIERVQRVLVAQNANFEDLQNRYPDLQMLQQSEAMSQFSSQFFQHSKANQGLYLVDPLGNLVMYYNDDMPAKLIRADLLKLLKFSWAG